MALVTKFHTFSDGYIPAALITAARLNTNWDTLYTLVNGQIDQDNLATDYWFVHNVATLPAWLSSYEGKILYAEDTRTLSVATNTAWVALLVAVHASNHFAAGSDPIRLDELKAPTAVTTLNATATLHGLLPALSDDVATFLTGKGTWVNPKLDDLSATDNNTDLNASTTAHGLLPRLDDDASHYLNGDGTWATPTAAVCTVVADSSSPRVTISNNTSRSKTSDTAVKIKEILINEAVTGSIAVTWDCVSGTNAREITTEVYINGVDAGLASAECSTDTEPVAGSVTLTGPHTGAFETGDLIQIYGNYTGSSAAATVTNLQLKYNWQIVSIDTYTLASPLEITATTAISTTNQDPA